MKQDHKKAYFNQRDECRSKGLIEKKPPRNPKPSISSATKFNENEKKLIQSLAQAIESTSTTPTTNTPSSDFLQLTMHHNLLNHVLSLSSNPN